ncbi:dihydrofolate reductase [Sphingomonas sp. 3-13AW]|uniref:dihydrofolate reductase n=1 Tax=Sphingomonas sp. 3-13AW TaxID=3050450 RepID=UPI003BB61811
MNPRITLVLAHDDAGAIGAGNGLPWPRIPEDMKHFRDVTRGRSVIMGRRTVETLGKPLPWRNNIVLTRDPAWHMDNVTVVHDIQTAVKAGGTNELMVIGGADVYRQFLPLASRILLTRVGGTYPADVFWKPDLTDWTETARAEVVQDGAVACTFLTYERRA